MLWKILSGLAAIALAVGVWFSLQTQKALKAEKELANRAIDNLKTTKEKLSSGADKKAAREAELVKLEKQRDDLNTEVARVTSDSDAKKKEAETIQKTLEEVAKQLAALEEQIDKAGNIKQLLAKVDELNSQKEAADKKVVNQKQQLADADVRLTKVNSEITRLEEVERRNRAGVVEPDFTARISQPYTGFGFVILNKGNLGGLIANAILDVKRGNRIVARLKVRDVEQAMSVADLMPGTLAEGESIRSGDLVVPAKVPAPPPAPAPAPAADPTAAPEAPMPGGAAPSPDPFGAPPAGGMAPMAPPTPEAPAPAAPATTDPFAPMPPAGGTAPAPAPAGGAPAAPATTTDPFAPPAGAPPAPAPTTN